MNFPCISNKETNKRKINGIKMNKVKNNFMTGRKDGVKG